MSSAPSARNTKGPQSQTTGDRYNVPNAALRGASSAFSKPPVKPKPLTNTYTGNGNGALLAATKVGTTGTARNATSTTTSGRTTPLGRDWTGGSARSSARPNASPMRQLSNSSSSSALALPEDSQADRGPSPSNIAARLAAARHLASKPPAQASSSPWMSEREPSESRSRRRHALIDRGLNSSRASSEETRPTDDTPIAPTTSLVQLFEKKGPPTRTLSPAPYITQTPPPIRSPKPQRKITLPAEPDDDAPLQRQKTRTPPPVNPKTKPRLDMSHTDNTKKDERSFHLLRKDTLGTPPKTKPAQLAAVKIAPRPKPPPKNISQRSRPKSEDMTSSSVSMKRQISSAMSVSEVPSSPSSFVSAREEQEIEAEKPKPVLPPPRRSACAKPDAEAEVKPKAATPLPPKPRASSKITSPVPPPQRLSPRRASLGGSPTPTGILYHSNYQRESVKAITKHMTGESLSNAIVGAALASSRNNSPNPSRMATPPITMRKQHHHHSPFHHSPSPPKPHSTGKLRTTMRKEASSSSDEDKSDRYKRKGTRIMGMGRKHPNKHHEGTRKRWRDQITERERKRYEGVWAANKGLFIQPNTSRSATEDPMLEVLNLVTKDIWARSRLPEHELEEVWELVDGQGVGRLRRDEFVVGMWLIDQRLKGRKIPAKVSESVWASVRGAGVKIKIKHK